MLWAAVPDSLPPAVESAYSDTWLDALDHARDADALVAATVMLQSARLTRGIAEGISLRAHSRRSKWNVIIDTALARGRLARDIEMTLRWYRSQSLYYAGRVEDAIDSIDRVCADYVEREIIAGFWATRDMSIRWAMSVNGARRRTHRMAAQARRTANLALTQRWAMTPSKREHTCARYATILAFADEKIALRVVREFLDPGIDRLYVSLDALAVTEREDLPSCIVFLALVVKYLRRRNLARDRADAVLRELNALLDGGLVRNDERRERIRAEIVERLSSPIPSDISTPEKADEEAFLGMAKGLAGDIAADQVGKILGA